MVAGLWSPHALASARTSSRELAATLKSIGLDVVLDEQAPAGEDELVLALLDVYAGPSIAERARVVVSRGEDTESLAAVLSGWAQRELPPVGDDLAGEEALVHFVADWLLAWFGHSDRVNRSSVTC